MSSGRGKVTTLVKLPQLQMNAVNIPAWRGRGSTVLTPNSATMDSNWLLGEGGSVFFKGMAIYHAPVQDTIHSQDNTGISNWT